MLRAAIISLFITSTALANPWYVNDDGKFDFDNIQAAVDAASDGDMIFVYPGTYTSTADEVVNMLGKAVTLRSLYPNNPDVVAATIIDGEGVRRGIVCDSDETSKTIIEGFTITNGYAKNGGGMWNDYSSPTLNGCTFTSNYAVFGGGMSNDNNSPTLTDCTFTNNSATFAGGMGNYNSSSPTLTDCTFTGNTATYNGGGMYNYKSNPTLTDTTVCSNSPDQINGDWTDNGGNTIADECPSDCPDINGDGYVNVTDLLAVIDQWGLTDSPADVNFDGIVNVSDLLILIGNWGECE